MAWIWLLANTVLETATNIWLYTEIIPKLSLFCFIKSIKFNIFIIIVVSDTGPRGEGLLNSQWTFKTFFLLNLLNLHIIGTEIKLQLTRLAFLIWNHGLLIKTWSYKVGDVALWRSSSPGISLQNQKKKKDTKYMRGAACIVNFPSVLQCSPFLVTLSSYYCFLCKK